MKPNARQVGLVDDSPHERLLLRTMLERLPDIEIVGEASDLKGAKALLERPGIDLVFLDIELGRENSFSLLRGAGRFPPVVFTTVHRQFALSAFDVEAVDYLVKPVREDRLVRALAKLDALAGRIGPSTRPARCCARCGSGWQTFGGPHGIGEPSRPPRSAGLGIAPEKRRCGAVGPLDSGEARGGAGGEALRARRENHAPQFGPCPGARTCRVREIVGIAACLSAEGLGWNPCMMRAGAHENCPSKVD